MWTSQFVSVKGEVTQNIWRFPRSVNTPQFIVFDIYQMFVKVLFMYGSEQVSETGETQESQVSGQDSASSCTWKTRTRTLRTGLKEHVESVTDVHHSSFIRTQVVLLIHQVEQQSTGVTENPGVLQEEKKLQHFVWMFSVILTHVNVLFTFIQSFYFISTVTK